MNPEGVAGSRGGRMIHTLREVGRGKAGEVEVDAQHSGERRTLCRTRFFGMLGRTQGTPGWADDPVRRQGICQWMGIRAVVGFLLGRTFDVSIRGWCRFIFKLCNNKQQSLGQEWSLSEVGTPPPKY